MDALKDELDELYPKLHELRNNEADKEILIARIERGMGSYRSGKNTEACSIYPCTAWCMPESQGMVYRILIRSSSAINYIMSLVCITYVR